MCLFEGIFLFLMYEMFVCVCAYIVCSFTFLFNEYHLPILYILSYVAYAVYDVGVRMPPPPLPPEQYYSLLRFSPPHVAGVAAADVLGNDWALDDVCTFSLIKFRYCVSRRTAISDATYSWTSSFLSNLIWRDTVRYTRRATLFERRPTVWQVCSTGSAVAVTDAKKKEKRCVIKYKYQFSVWLHDMGSDLQNNKCLHMNLECLPKLT